MGVQIRNQNVTLYPRDGSSWFIGDNYALSFPDLYELYVDSDELSVYTYNLDTAYCHSVQVTIGLVSRTEFISHFVPGRETRELIASINALTSAVAFDGGSASKGIIAKLLGK